VILLNRVWFSACNLTITDYLSGDLSLGILNGLPLGSWRWFRAILASFTFERFASPKENERRATHWPDGPHSKLRKFRKTSLISSKLPHGSRRLLFFPFAFSQRSKVYLNHPRIAGFPALAFRFFSVSIRNRWSWPQDLNFVTKSPPTVERHGAFFEAVGGDFVTMARSLN